MKRQSGRIYWRSASNIALVKYWGKKPVQIPANPSLSMTLSKAYTEMTLEYFPRAEKDGENWIEFFFEGKPLEKFKQKIVAYMQSLILQYPQLEDYSYRISSHNTFPHSTGIASSASSMSALGLCLAELLLPESDQPDSKPGFLREASRLARLASGSACRSVYGGYVIWGKLGQMEGTSDEYAVPVPFEVHPSFREMKDSILVVSNREKSVSSRAGHALMENHIYAGMRYQLAADNAMALICALRDGNMNSFVRITEMEALNLHALMMTSDPSYLLIEPETLKIVNAIRRFREETGIPACFTLDAGPNVHLIYPADYEKAIKKLIHDELSVYCHEGQWIDDETGSGPENLK